LVSGLQGSGGGTTFKLLSSVTEARAGKMDPTERGSAERVTDAGAFWGN